MVLLNGNGAGVASGSKDTTTATFRADVVAESMKQPVLVDFWAPWCGPCKQLTPVIEKAVASAKGKVKLVKMNIDEHPEIAGQLGIQSIPAVIAFDKGRPIDGFVGVLPETQITGFIERLVGPLGSTIDDMMAQAVALAEADDKEGALELYTAILEEDSTRLAALGAVAKLYIEMGDLATARDYLAAVPDDKEGDSAIVAARAVLDLAEQAASLGDLSGLDATVQSKPNDHQARFDLALALGASGEREAATDHLIEIIKRDRTWNDDGARKQLLTFFEAWGPMDEMTKAGRRKLSAVLFR